MVHSRVKYTVYWHILQSEAGCVGSERSSEVVLVGGCEEVD